MTGVVNPVPAQTLASLVSIRQRFARSVNLERDAAQQDLEGYTLTARALDVIKRVVDALHDPRADRAVSITGPYGSGKSSLALFLTLLLGPDGTSRNKADELLGSSNPELQQSLAAARKQSSANGFILCTVVAQREPIVVTLVRALRVGLLRYAGSENQARKTPVFAQVLDSGKDISAIQMRDFINAFSTVAPTLIVLDEFGKNLEQFVSTGGSEADLFVLQEIAEWAGTATIHPVLLLTLQHLSFDDYAAVASPARRREWSKVQGRFADVAFVDSAAQAQALIISVFDQQCALPVWSKAMQADITAAGCGSMLHVPITQVYPLHPIVAAALPELCARYGQNERTLFSFLAGPDTGAVPEFLRNHSGDRDDVLPCVRLDAVYDFFLQSASTMVAAAATASRWLEIETRLRDTAGLDAGKLRILKNIAVLNLVAAGGALRASKAMVIAVATDTRPGTESQAVVSDQLEKLERDGLITYRSFADEYRIWRGTDFDLKGSVELARRRLAEVPVVALLEEVRPQRPVIAARHSQRKGILRIFERHFVSANHPFRIATGQDFDGAVLLCVEGTWQTRVVTEQGTDSRPIVVGIARDTLAVERAARELGAHVEVLKSAEGLAADWVAKSELRERLANAAAALDTAIEATFGAGAQNLQWEVVGASAPVKRGRRPRALPLSRLLSDLCDQRYPDAPVIRTEMLSRRELTTQGAAARRELLNSMIESRHKPDLGIVGYGPERAMYEAMLAESGIHSLRKGVLDFGAPHPKSQRSKLNFAPAWDLLEKLLTDSQLRRVGLQEIATQLMAPPLGIKHGPLPVLITAALLAHASSIAIYENGTFVTRLDAPVLERLTKNYDLFAIKNFDIRGSRQVLLEKLAQQLWERRLGEKGINTASLLSVVRPLVSAARNWPVFTRKTRELSGQAHAVRAALLEATEPDELLFKTLPLAVGSEPFVSSDKTDARRVGSFVDTLNTALQELNECFNNLLNRTEAHLGASLGVTSRDIQQEVSRRITPLANVVHEPDLKALVLACKADDLDRKDWLERLAMIVAGKAPMEWTDEDFGRFTLRLDLLAATMRRIEGLYSEHAQAPGQGFEAVRMTMTTAGGADHARLIWLGGSEQHQLTIVATQMLAEAEKLAGQVGREQLLAILAKAVLGGHNNGAVGTNGAAKVE